MKKIHVKKALSLLLSMVLCVCAVFSVPFFAAAEEPAESSSVEGGVPKIVVATEDGNGVELKKADGYVQAQITITDTDGTELSDAVNIKVRGNTTALDAIQKKSFTFKFEKKKDVLGMGKGKKWAIVSNVFDSTLLRNFLAFETADELELAYTSQHKFVELWLDGSFRGSYVLFEPVQEGKDRVNIDIESNDGKKDFLVEYETETAMASSDDLYFTAGGHRFIATDPDEPDDEQLAYIQETLDDVINTMKTGTQEEIAEKVDLTSFAKYYLLNEYFKTYDFSVTSVFFYYQNGKLYAGPPWDYDISMGNTDPEKGPRCRKASSPRDVFANSNLCAYLVDDAWFMDIVKTVYEEHYDYFAQIHTDGGVLDTLRSTYSKTIDRNFTEAGWNPSRNWINIQRRNDSTYDGNYNFLKNWLKERNEWFEEYLEPFVREYLIGDTDGSEDVSILDATAIQRILAELDYDPYYVIRGTITDKELNILDATAIQRYLAEFEDPHGIGAVSKAKFR